VEHALIVQGYHQSKEEQRDRVENNQAVEDMFIICPLFQMEYVA
jgi:hypothetical protein